ncbi:MAG: DUF1326 domain-containing protein [Acidobacteriota bacterium]|nr:DUF1326 domain-containing protein [Acidobacteriota bacterium]
MSDLLMGHPSWWAKGILFENCNCQLVCPGHIHFDQMCTHERCVGYWAIRVAAGRFGDVPLDGARAVVAFDAPRHMIDGGWTEVILIDESNDALQRSALESIFTGRAGGPWEKLSQFVGRRLDTRYPHIEFAEEETVKSVRIAGLFESVVSRIRGRDRAQPVMLRNMFNQIHSPEQVLALGTTTYDDGTIRMNTSKTHGLFSDFSWRVDRA